MPIIDPNFLGDPYDLRVAIEGIKISRDVLNQSAMARYIRKEHFPGREVVTQTDFETYARQYGRTSYHPVGTCRMGVDAEAVVDPELRVRGVSGLRICDSSVMPRLVSSNTNAASIMIGEKASVMIMGNA
jgi:choline dehydrogenase-like flavoprotein